MSIDLNIRCSECNDSMVADEDCFCDKCVAELKKQIEDLIDEVRDLEAQLAEVE